MASMPQLRMDPPPRSLVPDAYDCIMVRIINDPPNTRLRRENKRPTAGSPQILQNYRTASSTQENNLDRKGPIQG